MSVEKDAKDRGGDKGPRGQNYLNEYEEIVAPLRDEPIAFLEVGVFQGKSMALWTAYFTKAKVWGMDVDLTRSAAKMGDLEKLGFFGSDACELTLVKCDSTDPASVKNQDLPKFDVILDDGLHTGDAQMKTFQNLFYDHLKPGGIYIVEDTHPNKSFAFFKDLADKMSLFHVPIPRRNLLESDNIDKNLQSQSDPGAKYVKQVTFLRRRIFIKRNEW